MGIFSIAEAEADEKSSAAAAKSSCEDAAGRHKKSSEANSLPKGALKRLAAGFCDALDGLAADDGETIAFEVSEAVAGGSEEEEVASDASAGCGSSECAL